MSEENFSEVSNSPKLERQSTDSKNRRFKKAMSTLLRRRTNSNENTGGSALSPKPSADEMESENGKLSNPKPAAFEDQVTKSAKTEKLKYIDFNYYKISLEKDKPVQST